MAWKPQRAKLSQNFLYNRNLVDQLVRQSSLKGTDTVIEIGPGKGIITEQLLRVCKHVIAIELDPEWYEYNTQKFSREIKEGLLEVVHLDFLKYKLPQKPYKVFANIPFNIEGKILRKLLQAQTQPEDTYIILRKDLAERISGIYKSSQFTLQYAPWFTFEIVEELEQTDYEPAARMDTVMLRFLRRSKPFLPQKEMPVYKQFIETAFSSGNKLKNNVKKYFSHEQWHRLSQANNFNPKATPTQLTLEQWIRLFNFAKVNRNLL